MHKKHPFIKLVKNIPSNQQNQNVSTEYSESRNNIMSLQNNLGMPKSCVKTQKPWIYQINIRLSKKVTKSQNESTENP